VLAAGKLRCWGLGLYGALGHGNQSSIGDDETPASAGDVPVGGDVLQIVAAGSYTCALLGTGGVRCWGAVPLRSGERRRIGDDETPASVGDMEIGGKAQQLAGSDSHTCALLTTGRVRCWGSSEFGQLGYASTQYIGDDETPATMGDVFIGP
jgi:alpha-tubulin suppressor-like RCC1 family protein